MGEEAWILKDVADAAPLGGEREVRGSVNEHELIQAHGRRIWGE